MKFYSDTVPAKTQDILNKIKKIPDLQQFYLTGGTALSLYLGHRESEDLDFFAQISFHPEILQEKLAPFGKLEITMIDEKTLNVFLDGVKLQFLHYPYALLEPFIPWNDIQLSSIIDIACTKLITISMRGSKKDFIDLYAILQQTTLPELFSKLDEKYSKVQYNYPHILKSLVYFADADEQPMPKMHISLEWQQVKDFIVKQVKAFSF